MPLQLTICPECAAPAETTDEGHVDSTDGPVPVVRVRCIRHHWFLLGANESASSNAYFPTPALPGSAATRGLPHGVRAAASGMDSGVSGGSHG